TDAPACRRWLGEIAGEITTGRDRKAERRVNIAFTYAGLRALGLDPEIGRQFSQEFIEGITGERRSRALGDVDDSAPDCWLWGGAHGAAVHVLLMLFACDTAGLNELSDRIESGVCASGFDVAHRLDTSDLDGVE